MSTYRKEWPCCGDVSETQSWEPEECPFCAAPTLSRRPAAEPEEANLAGFIAEIEAQPGGKEEVAAARQWARDYIAAEVAAEQPAAEPELLGEVADVIELYAENYDTMARIGSDGRVECTSVATDLRQNIIPQIKAKIAAHLSAAGQGKDSERLDSMQVQRLREAVTEAAYEWSQYVEVDNAPRSCAEHIDQAFTRARDAAMKAGAQGGGNA